MHRIGFNYANIHCIKISYMLHTCTCTYDYIIPIYVYIYIQIYIYASRHVQYYKHILLYKYILNIYIYIHTQIYVRNWFAASVMDQHGSALQDQGPVKRAWDEAVMSAAMSTA